MNRKDLLIVLAGLLILVIFVLSIPYFFPEGESIQKPETCEVGEVYKEDYITSKTDYTITESKELRLVLEVKNESGPINSMGILPPDGTVKTNPFLSAYSFD